MLRDFLIANRETILAQARARVALRSAPLHVEAELTHGLPVFLDQLDAALRGAVGSPSLDHANIHDSAARHGDHLYHQGLTIAQVVNSYGDLCQVITGLAVEQKASVSPADFQILNLCLDDATAGAVTAFARLRERAVADEGTERLGILSHELRNALGTAILAFDYVKKGNVSTGGSTSAMVDRSLMRLQWLVDRSLADVRLEAGSLDLQRFPLWELVQEAEVGGAVLAQSKSVQLVVTPVDRAVMVHADRAVLASAVANLLQNAFKFTLPGTVVTLRVTTTPTRVLIAVEDHCGGLPAGDTESLLKPFVQKGRDRTGVGLGLSICVKAAQKMAGELHIRDIPGVGCVFTLDLPKQPPPPASIQARRERRSDNGAR